MRFAGDLRCHLTLEEMQKRSSHLKPGDYIKMPGNFIGHDEDCLAMVTRIFPNLIEFQLPYGYKRHLSKFECMDMPIIKPGEFHKSSIDERQIKALKTIRRL